MRYPMKLINGHLISVIGKGDWLIDTGSPASFGITSLSLASIEHEIANGFMGLDATSLSEQIGHPLNGLIGVDILNDYDIVFDVPAGEITISETRLQFEGVEIPTTDVMGIPLIRAEVAGHEMTAFFDTGAQVSYWETNVFLPEDLIGTFQDFYPGIGDFSTDLYFVLCRIGGVEFRIRGGVLPTSLKLLLSMGGAECIIGNEVMHDYRVGYFPKRNVIVIGNDG